MAALVVATAFGEVHTPQLEGNKRWFLWSWREQGFPPSLKDAVTGFHHHEGTLLALLKEYYARG